MLAREDVYFRMLKPMGKGWRAVGAKVTQRPGETLTQTENRAKAAARSMASVDRVRVQVRRYKTAPTPRNPGSPGGAALRVARLPANNAWALVFGDQIIPPGDTGQRLWTDRAALVWELRRLGLEVARSGKVSSAPAAKRNPASTWDPYKPATERGRSGKWALYEQGGSWWLVQDGALGSAFAVPNDWLRHYLGSAEHVKHIHARAAGHGAVPNPGGTDAAATMFEDFHGRPPAKYSRRRVPVPDGQLVELGPLAAVEYIAAKHGDPESIYRHEFGRRKPRLLTDTHGRHLFVAGGGFSVQPAGIVG